MNSATNRMNWHILVTEMRNMNSITLSRSHFGGHWRNFNHQCEGVWSESGLTCRTMASSQQSAQSTSVRHRAEYISQRLYKNPSMSHCADATMPLFISTEAGDSSSNLFNSQTCEGVQRGRGTVGINKRTFRQGPHTWRHAQKAAFCSLMMFCRWCVRPTRTVMWSLDNYWCTTLIRSVYHDILDDWWTFLCRSPEKQS